MNVLVILQLRSISRRSRAKATIDFQSLPRVGESVEFQDLVAYGFTVAEVTHSFEGEDPKIRVWLSDTDGKPETIEDDDLAGVEEALREKGWQVM